MGEPEERPGETRAPAWLIALALALAAASPAASQTDDVAALRARWEGTWRLAVSQSRGEQIVDRAVDQAVSAMNFFLRPVVRPALRDATPVNLALHLTFEGDRLTMQFDDDERYTTRVGRTGRARTRDGEPMQVTQRFRDNGDLEQVFQAEAGTRWYVWHRVADDRVRIDATTQSDSLPQPMHYALHYRR